MKPIKVGTVLRKIKRTGVEQEAFVGKLELVRK